MHNGVDGVKDHVMNKAGGSWNAPSVPATSVTNRSEALHRQGHQPGSHGQEAEEEEEAQEVQEQGAWPSPVHCG